jgi:hypothetical protein
MRLPRPSVPLSGVGRRFGAVIRGDDVETLTPSLRTFDPTAEGSTVDDGRTSWRVKPLVRGEGARHSGATVKLRKAPYGRRLARQQELLHPPVQKLGDEQHVPLRTRHLVNPAELFQAFPRPPEHSQKLAVER